MSNTVESAAGVVTYLWAAPNRDTVQADEVGDCPGVFDANECKPGRCLLCSQCSRMQEKSL